MASSPKGKESSSTTNLDTSDKKSPRNNNNTDSSSYLIKKCSLFEPKHSKSLLENICEVVEGFQHDFNALNESISSESKREKQSKSGRFQILINFFKIENLKLDDN